MNNQFDYNIHLRERTPYRHKKRHEYAEENGVCKNSEQPLRKSAFCSCKKDNVLKNIGSDKPQKEIHTNIFRHKFREIPDDFLKDNPDTPDEKGCFFTVLQIG